jgi:hypothetical protein
VEGKLWSGNAQMTHIPALGAKNPSWRKELTSQIAGGKGVDGIVDGLWTCRRGGQVFVFNSTSKPIETEIGGTAVKVEPYTIWANDSDTTKR